MVDNHAIVDETVRTEYRPDKKDDILCISDSTSVNNQGAISTMEKASSK